MGKCGAIQRSTGGVQLEGVLGTGEVPFLCPLLKGTFACSCLLEGGGLDLVESVGGGVEACLLGDDPGDSLAFELFIDRGPDEEVTNVGLVSSERGE